MTHHTVKSSNIKSIGYDPETKKLEVMFKNGGHYEYEDVSPENYEHFKNSDSIGKHFHGSIKGKFKTNKLNKDE